MLRKTKTNLGKLSLSINVKHRSQKDIPTDLDEMTTKALAVSTPTKGITSTIDLTAAVEVVISSTLVEVEVAQ